MWVEFPCELLCQMWSVLNLSAMNYMGVLLRNVKMYCGSYFSRLNYHSSMEVGLLGIVCTEIVNFINIICG